MKFRIILPVLVLLAILVASCAPPPELRNNDNLHDTSLIAGDPCMAPCWQNITPGETSWRDAVIIVEDNALYADVEEVSDDESAAKAVGWKQGEDGPLCCQMSATDGEIVDAIFLLLAPDFTVGDLFDVIGEPELLTGSEVTDDQAIMLLIYPEIPLVIYSFVAGAENGVLSASSEVIGVIYMTAENMDSVLETTDLYAWDGYQSYAAYVGRDFDHTAIPASENEEETEE